ncbi:hypothetical protein BBO99_00000951 [Phytophthora kernoviae]|uniref:F-box/LRR-repeat protein 15-like leucin rich repeat domain-containing protein n=2 Tax=Phytophthora kernoviae TaxID=325452 RepID=A0A421FCT4_9STRA|nr:hypothetical protein G195_008079 [Phytophthora kernoviae 00238/432]KAG2531676.1 hypothetical protein JM16_000719 [Phytophthora kernoviae]KAG2533006.1 hypothetical protein JM18_000801 [Phytophthora kernoviae]RLN37739.1 hypothetical protein BBI17_000853 [Phytophthora kernoviae]RLN84898.1 hypothetical protein BBO99_00000951 [Phytophthora kernoviae]
MGVANRATTILQSQHQQDPDVLDLRPYAAELNDVLLTEMAQQLRANRVAGYSLLILSECKGFTPVLASGIERLDTLNFSSCRHLLSEGMREFISCCNRSLMRLNLSHCTALTDDALGWIGGALGPQGSRTRCSRLLSLDVSYTSGIRDRGLAALGVGCQALQFLNLEGLERISDSGVLHIVRGCPALRVFSLKRCQQLTNVTLENIGKHGSQLRSLNLSGCHAMSSAGLLAMIPGTPQLQSLNLEGCSYMCEDILAPVATKCPLLQTLNLAGCQEITESGIRTLAENMPFVQNARKYRGLEPRVDGLQIKYSVQEQTIRASAALRLQAFYRGHLGRQVAASWRVKMRAWHMYSEPNALQLNLDTMVVQLRESALHEDAVARAQQAKTLRKARELVNRDSASESESDDDWRDFQDEYGDQFWFSPSRNERLYLRPNDNAREKSILEMPCRVFWPLEQRWFDGRVTRYNRKKDRHRIEYDDGDHEWLSVFRTDASRVQLFNGLCWCMASMLDSSKRTLRAAIFLSVYFQRFDPQRMHWRSGTFRAYNEPSDTFLLIHDIHEDGSGKQQQSEQEWVNVFATENHFQVQDATTRQCDHFTMKLFQLTLPNEQHGKVVSTLQDELKLDNVTSVEARTSSIVTFRVEDEEMQAILNKLQRMGVGVQFGFCDVMSLTPGTTMQSRNRNKKKKRSVGRILERNTDVGTAVPVAEMYAHIEANSTLSRDSVGMLLISS